MVLNVYTDGGAINNPGPAAAACIILKEKKVLVKKTLFLGLNTNNFAEYSAIVLAFNELKKILIFNKKIKKIVFFSDSNLLVNQLNGFFKIKNPILRGLALKIKSWEADLGLPIFYKYIPREQNQEADKLVKQALQKF